MKAESVITNILNDRTTIINEIANKTIGIETLETRHSDSLDFHELSVWDIKKMLELAYTAGAMAK